MARAVQAVPVMARAVQAAAPVPEPMAGFGTDWTDLPADWTDLPADSTDRTDSTHLPAYRTDLPADSTDLPAYWPPSGSAW
jgi:hypothetical protein